MKKKNKLSQFVILIVFLFFGYVLTNMFRTKRLTEKEKSIIPYKVNQVLVFESNKSEIDTIIISEITLTKHPPNMGDMFWAKNTEVLRVQTENHNEIMYLGTENFSFETILSWTIRINGKNYIYGTNMKSINKKNQSRLVVNGIEYNDVLTFKRKERFKRPKDKNSKIYYEGIIPVDKLYWSKQNGIIKFEIKETNEIWEIKTLYN